MSEQIVFGYKRLFEIRILHHYWLDDGGKAFDTLEQNARDRRLLSYDIGSFLSLIPSAATAGELEGLGCIFKNTALGGIVATRSSMPIPTDAVFEFTVEVKDWVFFNYTALTFRPQKIYEIHHEPEKKTYRYKTNVPVLSNLTGTPRTVNSSKNLFLSREFPSLPSDEQVESLVLSGGALLQFTADGTGTQQISDDASSFPIFVHQEDIPFIVPPPGMVGAPERGVLISGDISSDVFAIIRLAALRGDDNDFSFVDDNGRARTLYPVFEIRFKNRSTVWQYLDKRTLSVMETRSEPLPLTYFGNASGNGSGKQKPGKGLVKAEKDPAGKIIRLVSEILV